MSVSVGPTFFLDRSLGGRIVANALREAGVAVEVHDDHFPQDAPDELWLPEITRRGWVALTRDNAIRKRRLQRHMAAYCGARLFVITGGEMTGADIADALTRLTPGIRKTAQENPAPFIATIQASGRIHVWRSREALIREIEG